MPRNMINRSELREEFIYIANELTGRFPDLDLRFNLRNGSKRCRLVMPTVTSHVVELSLGRGNPEALLHEAIFAVKELAQLFDD
jgi:hypothetical protein